MRNKNFTNFIFCHLSGNFKIILIYFDKRKFQERFDVKFKCKLSFRFSILKLTVSTIFETSLNNQVSDYAMNLRFKIKLVTF